MPSWGTPCLLIEKRMKKFLLIIVCGLTVCLLSCNEKKNGKEDEIIVPQDPRTDFSMERTSQDTTTVMDLANHFLETLKNKDIEGALDMLYEVDGQSAKPLSAEMRSQLRTTLQVFPVESYQIDEIILFSDSDSEVRYTTEMFKVEDGSNLPNTTKGSLHPYRIDNQWYLTIQLQKNEPKYEDD